MYSRFVTFVTAVMMLSACDAATRSLEPLPLAELRAAPLSVTVGGETLRLTPYLGRDFMPVSPPDGKPLVAVLRTKWAPGTRVDVVVRLWHPGGATLLRAADQVIQRTD